MINPNDPVFPSTEYGDTDISISTGIPIKLELASRILANLNLSVLTAQQQINPNSPHRSKYGKKDNESFTFAQFMALESLEFADALIIEYNNQQKEEK